MSDPRPTQTRSGLTRRGGSVLPRGVSGIDIDQVLAELDATIDYVETTRMELAESGRLLDVGETLAHLLGDVAVLAAVVEELVERLDD